MALKEQSLLLTIQALIVCVRFQQAFTPSGTYGLPSKRFEVKLTTLIVS